MVENVVEQWGSVLTELGLSLPESGMVLLQRYADLVCEANRVCSLVSEGDLGVLWERHMIDSISLAPVIGQLGFSGGALLDIGSGGGFPALPLKIVLPNLHVTVTERSEQKAGFLRRAIGALGLDNVQVVVGSFPAAGRNVNADVVTARAVERPETIEKAVSGYLRPGQVYLCQSGKVRLLRRSGFHVEHWEDGWSKRGLRRGTLHLVTTPSSAKR